jgi:hypothetical protein
MSLIMVTNAFKGSPLTASFLPVMPLPMRSLIPDEIDHTRTKAKHPQTNGICERFH